MKLKIKIKKIGNTYMPRDIKKGDWVDLAAACEVYFKAPQSETLKRKTVNGVTTAYRNVKFSKKLVPLGVAIKLPAGFEAVLVPRSSLHKYGLIQANSIGIIDNSYNGNGDEWKLPLIALAETTIPEGARVCQFRIQLSQKANIWQKLKWLFTNGIKIEEVQDLENINRGGFGSTGV